MSSKTKETDLHKAAKTGKVEVIRDRLYDKLCDPTTHNIHGKTAAFMYFIYLLTKANECIDLAPILNKTGNPLCTDCLKTDEIDCFVELLWFTYNPEIAYQDERKEIFDMLDYCFQFSDAPIRKLYMEIVNVFISPSHQRRYFVQKILEQNLPSDYCLIASMFEMNELLIDTNFVNLRSSFLRELFTLFLANESFFGEYISEVLSTGWSLNIPDQASEFCKLLKVQPPYKTFSFVKCLIQYDIDFAEFTNQCELHLPPEVFGETAAKVLVPLSNFINAPIELSRSLQYPMPKKLSYYNFNETESVVDDYSNIIRGKCNFNQVVSLQNLTRMSVRKYYFTRHTHFKALLLLYSLNMPVTTRNFLCYNYYNLKF